MGDGKAHSSRSCLAIELRLVEREDLLVKNDEVDRHVVCKKEILDGIDGNLEGLLFWIAKDAGGDQGAFCILPAAPVLRHGECSRPHRHPPIGIHLRR